MTRSRARMWAATVPTILLFGAAVGWAAAQTIRPAEDPLPPAQPVSYEVEAGTLERTMGFTATAEWELTEAAENHHAGVVTSIDISSEQLVRPGDVVYSVGRRPVVVAAGELPAFRDLRQGDSGPDVSQLQGLLGDLGFYAGPVDGEFGAATLRAVRAWQRSLGIDDDGVVRQGDVAFLPGLPARVVFDESIRVGQSVTPASSSLSVAEGPRFVIRLAREQLDLVPLTGDVVLHSPQGTWTAVIGTAIESADGQTDLVLEPADGESICGDDCLGVVPPGERVSLRAEIVVLEPVDGPIVPVAAIQTDARGATSVRIVGQGHREVDIVASVGGFAIVSGVDVGESILLDEGAP
jgi:peptidoglycan hydrolase-like protein with peptidoglycan-binding domain